MRPAAWALLPALLAVVVAATPASAQDGRGVRVAPAIVEQDLPDGHLERAVTFLDEGAPTGWDVDLRVARLGHDLDGRPLFEDDPDVASHVQIDPVIELGPGQRVDPRLTATVPDGRGGLYAAVVGTFTPQGADGIVVERLRLASLLLLRGPQPWDERVEVDSVEISHDPIGGGHELLVVVHNVGDVHVRPAGRARVTAPDGTDLGTFELTEELVLPGYARRLGGAWLPRGPLPERVTVEVQIDHPSANRTFDVEVTAGPLRAATSTAPEGSSTNDLSRWPLISVGGLLLALALLLLVLAWRRRRDEEDDDEGEDGGESGARPPLEATGSVRDLVAVP